MCIRDRLYSLLHPREMRADCVTIIGNNEATQKDSELMTMLAAGGYTVREITDCHTSVSYTHLIIKIWVTFWTLENTAWKARFFFCLKGEKQAQNYSNYYIFRRYIMETYGPVSYTHLDVYKRQGKPLPQPFCGGKPAAV